MRQGCKKICSLVLGLALAFGIVPGSSSNVWDHEIKAQAAVKTDAWTVTAAQVGASVPANDYNKRAAVDKHVLCSGDDLTIDFSHGNFNDNHLMIRYNNVVFQDRHYTGDPGNSMKTYSETVASNGGTYSYKVPTHEEICKRLDSTGTEENRAKANAKFLFWYGFAGNGIVDLYPAYMDTADFEGVTLKITPSNTQFMNAGDTKQFTATMVVRNFKDEFDEVAPLIEVTGKSVNWELEGNSSKDTVITPEGKLTLGADEKNHAVFLRAQYQEKAMKRYKVKLTQQSGRLFDYTDMQAKVSFLDDKRNAYYFSMKETNNNLAPYMIRNVGTKTYYYTLEKKVENAYESQLYYNSKDGYYTYYYNDDIIYNSTSVKVSRIAKNMFSDSDCKNLAKGEALVAYANGGKVADDSSFAVNGKRDYSSQTFYTSIKPVEETYAKNGKDVKAKGKLVVALTMSDEKPTLTKGKVTDKAASKAGSVKYDTKTGAITVKVKPNAPEQLFLWVFSYINVNGEEKIAEDYGFAPINVLTAPTTIKVYDGMKPDDVKGYKSDTVEVGGSVDFYINPCCKSNKVLVKAEDGTYTATVDKKCEDKFMVTPDPADPLHFIVTAKGLNNGKKTACKVLVKCDQNTKKATFTAYAVNSCCKLDVATGSGLSYDEETETVKIKASSTDKVTGTLTLSPTFSSNDFETTDKVKVLALGSAAGMGCDKGKVKVLQKPTKEQKAITAKLEKDKKTITITAKKGTAPNTTSYFVVFYNSIPNAGYKIIKVTADGATETTEKKEEIKEETK